MTLQKEGEKILESDIPVLTKVNFFEKQKRAGKQKVFRGLKQIKRDIGKPQALQGVLKVREGDSQIRFAERNLFVLKKTGISMKKKKFFK